MARARSERRRPRLLLGLAGLLLMAAFGYFGYAIVSSQTAQTRVAETYRPVEAVVLSSEVGSFFPGNPKSSTSYSAAIEYEYEVGGRRYRSDRYAYLNNGFRTHEEADEVVARYPAGAKLTAYYAPDDPADAVIDRGSPGLPAAVMALPFALLELVGLLTVVAALRGSKVKSP